MSRAARGAALALAAALGALAGCDRGPEPLVTAAMIEGDALPAPLAPTPGDPTRGEAVFVGRERGHCVICHQLASVDAPFQGDVGPPLTGVGERLSPAQIRLRIAAPTRVWPDTIMPAYYRVAGLHQVPPEHEGETILTAQEIEDLTVFLAGQVAGDGDGRARRE